MRLPSWVINGTTVLPAQSQSARNVATGGATGQSRLCMLLLGSAHIGEVQASVWDQATHEACAKAGIPLL